MTQEIDEAASSIQHRWQQRPHVGIILGTGSGNLTECIETDVLIDYDDIPHFPRSTAVGHQGQLVCGSLCGVPVITMEGRFHIYEGYSAAEITLPVRVMKHLGVELLIVSNAAGGMNPQYQSGDLVVIEDHINLMGVNPLIGPNNKRLGPRFPDMSRPYDAVLIDRALEIARRENFVAHRGVYLALTGPNYETRAEYRAYHRLGADVIGMSTVPEVIVAAHCGLRVLAVSTVTNQCLPDHLDPTHAEDVVAIASAAEPKLRKIILGVLADQFVGVPQRLERVSV